MEDGQKKPKVFYRCNGKKCESGSPVCFYTADPAYAMPLYAPIEIPNEPDAEMMAAWSKEAQEMAEYQTFLPVEKRMPCKRGLPVMDGAFPDGKEEGRSDGSV